MFALLFLVSMSACATAQRAETVQEAALFTLDTRPFDLDQVIRTHEATVLVFWATGCPCVSRYQERIDALTSFHPKVAVVAISSNVDDDLQTLEDLYPKRSPKVPLAIDPGGVFADAVGARSTPTAVIVDRQGTIRYLGWIDNERLPGRSGRQAFVEDALGAVLEGRDPEVAKGPAWGCRITRSLGEDTRCAVPP